MSALDKALLTLNTVERTARESTSYLAVRDARAKIVVTLVYLITILSFPLDNVGAIILCALYPVVGVSLAEVPWRRVLVPSLCVLPLLVCIGLFNPLLDRVPMLQLGSLTVTRGQVQFVSILLRGVLTVQATMLLILTTGFIPLCRALRRMHVPGIFTTQLLMLYRYIFVLLDEARDMQRARAARGYGRKHYTMRFWAVFMGQLLIRTAERARRIHGAMLSRGFNGEMPLGPARSRWSRQDTIFVAAACAACLIVRVADVPALFTLLATHT